jgi:hypothetical protein
MIRSAVPLFAALVATGAAAEPANQNITRWAEGTIAYRVKSTGVLNGHETWRLSVHPDGSRTMNATVRYSPRDVERHVVQRVDKNFGPLETYAQVWSGGAWRGAAFLRAAGKTLNVTAATPSGEQTQTLAIGDRLAVVPHVLATDSWRAMLYDKAKGGVQSVPAYNFNGAADGPTALLGRLMEYRLAYIGAQQVTVPAGTFSTDHFRIEDAVDIFISGADGLLVKFNYPAIDREHHLIEYRSGP